VQVVAEQPVHAIVGRALAVHPQVALRPEPFGALLYHYGSRRLVFLKHPDLVAVVGALPDHATVTGALDACAIAPGRRAGFVAALESLLESGMLVDRDGGDAP
jgi:putative mycofactocin binding protein MftB